MAKRDSTFQAQLINFRLEQHPNDRHTQSTRIHQVSDSESFLQILEPIEGLVHASQSTTSLSLPSTQRALQISDPYKRSGDQYECDDVAENRARESYWGEEESKILYSIVMRHYIPWTNRKAKRLVSQRSSSCSCIKYNQVTEVWEHISALLKEEGYNRTARQCQVKWQNMKERSKKRKIHKNEFGHDSRSMTHNSDHYRTNELGFIFSSTERSGNEKSSNGGEEYKIARKGNPNHHQDNHVETEAILSGLDAINNSLCGLNEAIQKHTSQMNAFIGFIHRLATSIEQTKDYI